MFNIDISWIYFVCSPFGQVFIASNFSFFFFIFLPVLHSFFLTFYSFFPFLCLFFFLLISFFFSFIFYFLFFVFFLFFNHFFLNFSSFFLRTVYGSLSSLPFLLLLSFLFFLTFCFFPPIHSFSLFYIFLYSALLFFLNFPISLSVSQYFHVSLNS